MGSCDNHTDPERWELGCVGDQVRNSFLIPQIIAFLEKHKPIEILDVGTATGYLPRQIDKKLSYRPKWTLLDSNEARIAFANANLDPDMQAETFSAEFLQLAEWRNQFEAILLTFTLLEIDNLTAALRKAVSCLRPGGVILIALPDGWADVLDLPKDQCLAFAKYGSLNIEKVDKFTGKPYPFKALRIESILEIGCQLNLSIFTFLRNNPENSVFLVALRKPFSASRGDS